MLAEVSGKPAVVDEIFNRHVYAATKVDDRVESLASVEELPLIGTTRGADGRWTEVTEDQQDELVEQQRKAWKKAHFDAKDAKGGKEGKDAKDAKADDDVGPFPYRTTVTLRRRGAPVPQTVIVKFKDGSTETVLWDDSENWARFSWVKPVKAVSAEIDPHNQHAMDVSKLDNGRVLKADRRGTRRVATDAGGVWQALLALVATL